MDKNTNFINLRNREIRILIPGHFDLIHAGHHQLIQEAKNAFKKVSLTIGIIQDNDSVPLLALHEKLETFKNFPEIDKILILKSKPTLSDLPTLSIDYLATGNLNYFPGSSQVLHFEKKVQIDSTEVFARVIRDFELHLEHLLQVGYKNSALNISKPKSISILCKRKVKQIKNRLWNCVPSLSLEESIDKARKSLQTTFTNWTETQESILRSWLSKYKSSTTVLFKTLKSLWLGENN